jgi:hypothetical protein
MGRRCWPLPLYPKPAGWLLALPFWRFWAVFGVAHTLLWVAAIGHVPLAGSRPALFWRNAPPWLWEGGRKHPGRWSFALNVTIQRSPPALCTRNNLARSRAGA